MKHYDFVRRHYRTRDGAKKWERVERLRCPHCRHIVRILPSESILPYKHYGTIHIQRVLERKEMDYPEAGNNTIQRWLKWFRGKIGLLVDIISLVLQKQLNPVKENSWDYLLALKKTDPRWLSRIAYSCNFLGP